MADVPFYNTRMGKHFYEKTMPDIAKNLERLANCMEGMSKDPDRLVKDDNTCKFCKGGMVKIGETSDTKLFVNTGESGKARTISVECIPCPDNAQCGLKGVPFRTSFLINFCPMCGRELGSED